MERLLSFCNVTTYDLNCDGQSIVLKLIQGDLTTSIRIVSSEDESIMAMAQPVTQKAIAAGKVLQAATISPKKRLAAVKEEIAEAAKDERSPVKVKSPSVARLNEDQVKEIRANWDQTVKACGGKKGAAAQQLAKIYDCSAKNIYAIIYRYSWNHI